MRNSAKLTSHKQWNVNEVDLMSEKGKLVFIRNSPHSMVTIKYSQCGYTGLLAGDVERNNIIYIVLLMRCVIWILISSITLY